MREPNESLARYYFALSRLIARLAGASARRSEQNGMEAAVAGTLVHAVTFVFVARLLLAGLAIWQQLLLLLPVAVLVWAWWSFIMYANALVLKALRAVGWFRESADRHLQSVLIGITTTGFAWHLIATGSWASILGYVWIAAVALNLTAAAALALMHAESAQ